MLLHLHHFHHFHHFPQLAPTKSLPSLPTPEQRKRLLYRNIRAIPPQFQHHHKIGFIKKDVRPEKGSKVQPHTPPPPLSKSSPLVVRSLVRRSLLTDWKTPPREIISTTSTQTCQQRRLSHILQGRQGISIAVGHPKITLTLRNILASLGLRPPLIPACLFTIRIKDGNHSKTRLCQGLRTTGPHGTSLPFGWLIFQPAPERVMCGSPSVIKAPLTTSSYTKIAVASVVKEGFLNSSNPLAIPISSLV